MIITLTTQYIYNCVVSFPNQGVTKVKVKKEQLTKQQKRRLADRVGMVNTKQKYFCLILQVLLIYHVVLWICRVTSLMYCVTDVHGERLRGWNWVDVIKVVK